MEKAEVQRIDKSKRLQRLLDDPSVLRQGAPINFGASRNAGSAQAWFMVGDQVLQANKMIRSSANEYMNALLGLHQETGMSDEALAEAYTIGVTAYACVQVRAKLVSKVPLLVKIGDETVTDPTNPLVQFVNQSVKYMSQIETSLAIWGKNYLHKRRNMNGYPVQLDWISPTIIDPILDEKNGSIVSYRVHMVPSPLTLNDIIYTHTLNPLDPNDGVSPYEVAMNSVKVERNIADFAVSFFANRARPDALLTFDEYLDETAFNDARQEWEKKFKGVENQHRTAVMPGAWNYTPISSNPEDLAMGELTDKVRENVLAIFGVSPVLVGLSSGSDQLSAQSTYEQAWSQAIQHIAVPQAEFIINDLNEEWVPELSTIYGEQIRIEIDEDQINAQTKATAERSNTSISLYNTGVITADESRGYIGQQGDEVALQRPPNLISMAWNDGLVTFNESRRYLGLPEVEDIGKGSGYIYDVDPRQQQQQGGFGNLFPFGFSQGVDMRNLPKIIVDPPQKQLHTKKPIIRNAIASYLEAIKSDGIHQEQHVLKHDPLREDETDKEALFDELRQWRQKQRSYTKKCLTKERDITPVDFECHVLDDSIQSLVRSGLDDGWYYSHVFDIAEEALRTEIVPEDEPFGITKEEYEAYWRDLNDLNVELATSWLEYMADVSADIEAALIDNPQVDFDFEQVFQRYRDSLIAKWIGTTEVPGILQRVVLAGMAKGNTILNSLNLDAERFDQRSKGFTREGPSAAFTISWEGFAEEAFAFVSEYGFDLIRNIDNTTRQQIASVMQRAIDENWTRDQIQAALGEILFDTNTPNDRIESRAKTISNTELGRAFNAGAENRWNVAGFTRAVWQTVRDQLVCPICRPLHGQVYELSTGIYSQRLGKNIKHIAHPECRCFGQPDPTSLNLDEMTAVADA